MRNIKNHRFNINLGYRKYIEGEEKKKIRHKEEKAKKDKEKEFQKQGNLRSDSCYLFFDGILK